MLVFYSGSRCSFTVKCKSFLDFDNSLNNGNRPFSKKKLSATKDGHRFYKQGLRKLEARALKKLPDVSRGQAEVVVC